MLAMSRVFIQLLATDARPGIYFWRLPPYDKPIYRGFYLKIWTRPFKLSSTLEKSLSAAPD
jgi:hypothetical protein